MLCTLNITYPPNDVICCDELVNKSIHVILTEHLAQSTNLRLMCNLIDPHMNGAHK